MPLLRTVYVVSDGLIERETRGGENNARKVARNLCAKLPVNSNIRVIERNFYLDKPDGYVDSACGSYLKKINGVVRRY